MLEEPFPNVDGVARLNDVFEFGIVCLHFSVDDALDLDAIGRGAFGETAREADRLHDGRSLRNRIGSRQLYLTCHVNAIAIDARHENRVAVLEHDVARELPMLNVMREDGATI